MEGRTGGKEIMKDYYKQEIEKVAMEKIAARAWKKYLPRLSDANYNKLLNAGVYNPDKELKGLRRGTHAILGKNGAKMVKNPYQAGAGYLEITRDYNRKLKNNPKLQLSNSIVERVKRDAPTDEAYSFSRNLAYKNSGKPLESIKGKTGFIYIPKGEHNKMVNQHGPETKKWFKDVMGVEPISRRDRANKKWTQAITERHEADEVRYTNNARKKGLLDKQNAPGRYFSHVSPKVLAQESANVAMMPREIKKNQYKAMRNYNTNLGISEADSIKSLTGTPYASSGVYDKKGANKAEKHFFDTGGFVRLK